MKKIYFILLLFIFLKFLLYSLEVDVDELQNIRGKNIVFENYTGPRTKYETVLQIKGIGIRLSQMQNQDNTEFKYFMKYSIIHAIDKEEKDKLDAIIFSIEKDAQVDHINNIQLIISGYLENKFKYTRKDATTLALFVLYYNAVYRGDIDYLTKKFKNIVFNYINNENAGISTKYTEWPGKTKILIPLTEIAQKGKISSLDTTELTEGKVIEELKKKDDKGIEERKDIVKIKEKEIEEQKKDINKEKKDIEEEKEKIKKEEENIKKEQQKLEEKKESIIKKEEELNKEKEQLSQIENEKDKEKKEKEILTKEEKLEKEKERIKKEEENIKKEQQKLEEKKDDITKREEDINKKEERIEKKEKEVITEKKDIEKDEIKKNIESDPQKAKKQLEKKEEEIAKKEKELEKRESELKKQQTDRNILSGRLYYLKIKDYMEGGHYNNEMYIINAATMEILVKSDLNTICGNKYDITEEGVIVISHLGNHNQNHNLVILDKDNLKEKIRGKDNIFWRSFIIFKEDYIYAIIKQDNNYYLGKFDKKLNLILKSEELVNNNTFISFFDNYIYINDPKKDIIVLNKENLKKVKRISP